MLQILRDCELSAYTLHHLSVVPWLLLVVAAIDFEVAKCV